jgi:hypothetical protein
VDGQETTEICQQLSSLKGKSLFFYNLDQSLLFEKILKNEKGQSFQVVEIKKKLPNHLLIYFKQQDPSYRLLVDNDVYLANQQNFISQNDQNFKDLVIVELSSHYQQQINPPKIRSDLNQTIIKLVTALEEYELSVLSIKLNQTESQLKIRRGWQYLFDFSSFSPETLAQQVKLIEAELTKQDFASPVKSIDLRFKLPVVKTETGDQEIETNQATSATDQAT